MPFGGDGSPLTMVLCEILDVILIVSCFSFCPWSSMLVIADWIQVYWLSRTTSVHLIDFCIGVFDWTQNSCVVENYGY